MTEFDDYSVYRPHLGPGETILWKGRPGKGHLITSQDAFAIPFSIFWCGFVVKSILDTGKLHPIGILFVCMGAYLLVGRFFWTAFVRSRTSYVVTNRKIIRMRLNKVDMLEGKNMPAMRVFANKDGSGTIVFGEERYARGGYSVKVNGMYLNQHAFSLENVPDVARVQRIIGDMER
jgi:hypothetical protein